jgi:hypothetical protein
MLTPVNAAPSAPGNPSRPWVAMETEVHGLVFRVPRRYLHLRFGDGSFEFGLRVLDFAPITLLGLNDRAFWREALRANVLADRALNGPADVRRSLGLQLHFNSVQTTTPAPRIVDPYGTWDGRSPPEGLRYFPRPDPLPDVPEEVRRMGREQDLFMPERPVRSPVTGEDLPEFIMCRLIPPDRSGTPGTPGYPCEWNLVYRNLPLRITLAREHLLRWREIRAEVVRLLDTFLVRGPEEALTPPPGWRPSIVNPVLIYDAN